MAIDTTSYTGADPSNDALNWDQKTKGKSAWSEIEITALKSLIKKYSQSEQDHQSDNRAGVYQWTQMKVYNDLHEKPLSKHTVMMMRNKYQYLMD